MVGSPEQHDWGFVPGGLETKNQAALQVIIFLKKGL
jgi:hypothetical protein